MSREFENAMCGFAARTILNATKPLARVEIFPKDGIFAKSLSKSWQNRILEWFVKEGHVIERRRNGVLLYEASNREALADTARVCPPIENEEDEEEPMHTAGYNKKEWDKWARVTVALRAIKRLLASHNSDGDSAKWQPRTTLFIAKKGDKFQQRAVMDPSWQKAFLNECIENGVLKTMDEVGIPLYGIESVAKVTGILKQNSELCIHTLLWPDQPCKIDHTKNQKPEDEESEEPEEESAEGEEDQPAEEKAEEKVPEVAAQPPPPAVETQEETEEEENDRDKAMGTILDLVKEVAGIQSSVSRSLEASTQLQKRLFNEIEHLHSKLDKIHDENVHLRKEHEEMQGTLSDLAEDVERVIKAVNPEDSSMNAIRKRLGELEKLSKDHAEALHNSNQLMRGSLAEASVAMVNAAAKTFIQTDHTAVLTKMETIESHLVEEQSRTQNVLREVFNALEKVRTEYKNHTRTPAILDRMNAIADELQKLQGLLPGLSANNDGLNFVSDKLARAQGRP